MLEQILKKFRDEPVEFVRKILHAEPDEWQADALNALARRPRIAIRSGHGVGKTALESWAICWFLFTRPFCKVPCTAPTRDQVNNILWSEISKWLKRSELLTELFEWQKTKICFRAQPERWAALAKSAARPENMAGFHEDHLLFVLDEASGIEDGIFEAIEGALTTSDAKLLICGNPTRNSGFFKRAFFEDRELYATFKVSSADSGRVANEYCKRLIKQYGADSDVVRVRVLGEFPKTEADGLIALELVEAATNREPVYEGELCIGVDVARFGNDETVIQPRIGKSALKFESYRRTDLMTTVGKIVAKTAELMKNFSLERATVNVDDDGVGGGVTDRLREVFTEKNLRVEVNGCHNGGKARDPHYANWATESWFALRDRFVSGEIILPKDEVLTAQLATRKYRLTSSDKLILEEKSAYKKRAGRSPDRADALVLAFAPTATVSSPPNFPLVNSYWR